jgi:hypothetical protein
VDYTPYLLTIEILVLVWGLALWFVKQKSSRGGLLNARHGSGESIEQRIRRNRDRIKSKSGRISHKRLSLKQRTMQVPTPWGWPHHKHNNYHQFGTPGVANTVRVFSDALMKEKEAVKGPMEDPRLNTCIRALLEDRYGRVTHPINEFEYRSVKAPLLRDPSEPYDQMANFGTREAEAIRNRLGQTPENKEEPSLEKTAFLSHQVNVKELKIPWGW